MKLQMSKGGAFVSVGSATDFAWTGSATVDLQAGSYRFTVDSGSAQMATITLAS